MERMCGEDLGSVSRVKSMFERMDERPEDAKACGRRGRGVGTTVRTNVRGNEVGEDVAEKHKRE